MQTDMTIKWATRVRSGGKKGSLVNFTQLTDMLHMQHVTVESFVKVIQLANSAVINNPRCK